MILRLLTDEGLKSDDGLSKLEKYYTIQGSKRVPVDELRDELYNIRKELEPMTEFEFVGGLRRKNKYVESIVVLCAGNKTLAKRIFEVCKCTDFDKVNNRCSKLVSINNKIIEEKFLVVSKDFYGTALVKFTGSSYFNKAVEERAKAVGIDAWNIKSKTEEEFFIKIHAPYVSPSCRECYFDISFPVEKTLISSNEFDLSKFVMSKDLNMRGIELDCFTHFDNSMNSFDFVIGSFMFKKQIAKAFYKAISKIKVPIIVKDFGFDLATPYRSLCNEVDWDKEFRAMLSCGIVLALNSSGNNLHPLLLNKYKNLGGRFVILGETNEDVLRLARKALLTKSSVLDEFRFHSILKRIYER